MDERDAGAQRRLDSSLRDELVHAILETNARRAASVDQLSAVDLFGLSLDELVEEYRRQRRLLLAGASSARVAPGSGTSAATASTPAQWHFEDPGPGSYVYRSPVSEQYIWERSG